MMYVLVRDGLTDEAFLSANVLGWEEMKEKVIPRCTPEETEKITGVPRAVVEELAHAYGKARAPFIRLGSGQSRYRNGAMTSRLITCLPALVGAWGKRGGGILTSAAASKAYDKDIVTRPDWKQKGTRLVNMCCIGQALTEDDRIKSLFVYSSNPPARHRTRTPSSKGFRGKTYSLSSTNAS